MIINRLWHQLSVAIHDFMRDEKNVRANNFVEVVIFTVS